MEIIALIAVGGGVAWMYSNYKRNKKKIEVLAKRSKRIEDHLGIGPPPAPTPEPAD